jgi:hypothetical protein
MRKQKRPEGKPVKGKQPAASEPRAPSELSAEDLERVAGGTASSTTANTYRVDPYKNFKFH